MRERERERERETETERERERLLHPNKVEHGIHHPLIKAVLDLQKLESE